MADNLPLRFIAHYEAECGDSYELYNFKSEYLKLYCEDCRDKHSYRFQYLEYRILKWETVREMWAGDGGVTNPYASND